MNEIVINELTEKLNITKKQIETVLTLLSEGCTIPFIARYRKEATGALDENKINEIEKEYTYYKNLLERKETVIRLIDEKGLLTEELKNNILKCEKLTEVEDLYRPFKEKKKTKASEAIKMGLEPLAKKIMSFPTEGSIENLCKPYDYDVNVCIENAGYIIAEWISDNAYYRKYIRNKIWNTGLIESKIKKNAVDEKKTYEIYYDFKDKIKYMKSYRTLAINRGEKEGIISVSLDYNKDEIIDFLKNKIIKNDKSYVVEIVLDSIKDALKRLILPSVEREIRSEMTEIADVNAINVFGINLENLLMTRPLKGYRVLGFDPAFRTGCKLACLDEQGNVMHIDVIYPHEPKNDKDGAIKKIKELISKYNLNLIAIGNGTASRESEELVASVVKELKDVYYIIVSEAGASVYSASKLAQKEFPDFEVQERSAVSIGRRVQDPLSELVKIDPKSIGVGEYQHDVDQKKLTENLDFTVSKIVNEVGVNINTASPSILKYVSGLTTTIINKIIKYKEKHIIKSREEIKDIGLSDKVYEQSIGFLRINDGENLLDNTGIHPESYNLTKELLNKLKLDLKDINTEEFKKVLNSINKEEISEYLKTDIYTITDIIKELLNPGLDPRTEVDPPILKSNILTIDDLKIGMELKGTVRNVASFGAFIDIGLHDDGLLHISKMSNKFVSDPNEIVSVGDIITCFVCDISKEKNKVSLSLIKN
ncbi:MAG: RNA-binding transcriptional accessory protein [Firmicutes bacterium]|nr:RNA-binding transcriptional accessory protein [Bacillota bacterium]